MTGFLTRGEGGHVKTDTQGERYVMTEPNLQKTRKRSSLEPSEGARPCRHLDSRLLASRTKTINTAISSHPVCDTRLHLWRLVAAALGNRNTAQVTGSIQPWHCPWRTKTRRTESLLLPHLPAVASGPHPVLSQPS